MVGCRILIALRSDERLKVLHREFRSWGSGSHCRSNGRPVPHRFHRPICWDGNGPPLDSSVLYHAPIPGDKCATERLLPSDGGTTTQLPEQRLRVVDSRQDDVAMAVKGSWCSPGLSAFDGVRRIAPSPPRGNNRPLFSCPFYRRRSPSPRRHVWMDCVERHSEQYRPEAGRRVCLGYGSEVDGCSSHKVRGRVLQQDELCRLGNLQVLHPDLVVFDLELGNPVPVLLSHLRDPKRVPGRHRPHRLPT